VPRRVAVALLARPAWCPAGIDPVAWRLALAEDILDVLATLAEVEAAVAIPAADAGLLSRLGWPGLQAYDLPALTVDDVFAATARDGYEQGVLVAGDAPDLPGMTIAKLLRPLTSRPVAAAPALGAPVGLLGLAATLPAPGWLPSATLDALSPQSLRRRAPTVTDVAPAPGWHRLRTPEDLARLDLRLEGWDATRALLTPAVPPSPPHPGRPA
jgi:hypothetical protein